jgi:aminocarboxymuconate-semialdehyde decarboxylase
VPSFRRPEHAFPAGRGRTVTFPQVSGRDVVVDIHAHLFPAGLADLSGPTGDRRWPALVTGEGAGRIMCGDTVFRQVRAPLWDRAARLAELDAAGVDIQVVSPVPVTLTYWADVQTAVDFTRAMNDALAAEVAASGGRLVGLGAVPLQDVGAAIDELTRVVTVLGLRGAEIGTVIAGRELDDPRLRPFFEAAQSLGAALFVHPMDGGAGVIRREGQPYDFGLGMLTDTAIAAAGLVFGGVLDEFPALRIVLAHGCGAFAWSYPRLRMGAQLGRIGDVTRFDELVKTLWVDALVFDPVHLSLLVHRFGGGHIMVGTDHPFVPSQLTGVPGLVRDAAAQRLITGAEASAILGTNAVDFLDLANSGDRPGTEPAASAGGMPCQTRPS